MAKSWPTRLLVFLIITGFMSLATYFITTGVVSSEYAKTTLSEDLAHFRTESYKLVNRYCTGSSPATAEFCHQLRANMDLKTDRVAEPIKAELLKDSAKIAGSALGAVTLLFAILIACAPEEKSAEQKRQEEKASAEGVKKVDATVQSF